MKLTALGSGGWFPSTHRHTCTYLLEINEQIVFLDTGSGISRLFDYGWVLDKYDTIHIIYTHYHHDHVAGLGYLPQFVSGKKLIIKGPGKPYYSNTCEEILTVYTRTPFFPKSIYEFTSEVEITDYDESGFEIAGIQIEVLKQIHADITFGLKLGDDLYFATDTEPIEETFKRASQTQVLIHECWGADGDLSGHSSASSIKEYLISYPVPATYLIHAHPSWSSEQIHTIESIFPPEMNVRYMIDGMTIVTN